MVVDITVPFPCPHCGRIVDVAEDTTFCEHVWFVHVWCDADPDTWVYCQRRFAGDYLSQLRARAMEAAPGELDPVELPGIPGQERFARGDFSPGDEVAQSIPYLEDLALAACPEGIVIYADSRYHSGVRCGLAPQDDEHQGQ